MLRCQTRFTSKLRIWDTDCSKTAAGWIFENTVTPGIERTMTITKSTQRFLDSTGCYWLLNSDLPFPVLIDLGYQDQWYCFSQRPCTWFHHNLGVASQHGYQWQNLTASALRFLCVETTWPKGRGVRIDIKANPWCIASTYWHEINTWRSLHASGEKISQTKPA